MEEPIDSTNVSAADTSIDELIHWLRAMRRRDPVTPLSQVLHGRFIDPSRLVDIACIDLMQRRRLGHPVTIEGYLDDMPELTSCSNRLDLIDAELCVNHELCVPSDIDDLAERFPDLHAQIRELAQLGGGVREANCLPAVPEASDDVRSISAESGDFSVEIIRPSHQSSPPSLSQQHPIELPEWFVGEHCVASSPGRWLIRGRDSLRGTSLALKVTELPALLTSRQSTQILDACEMASKVSHPGWVLPSIAAIQQRHLGVIRPWLFATPWLQVMSTLDQDAQLRHLASVAFSLASAHKVGATHGGIHAENLMIDHEGNTCVVDAACSRFGLAKWLGKESDSSDEIARLEKRIELDIQDLTKLIAVNSVEWSPGWTQTLMQEIHQSALSDLSDASYRIGQRLLQHADKEGNGDPRGARQNSWWNRVARWNSKKS